jgi:hypothetical protein
MATAMRETAKAMMMTRSTVNKTRKKPMPQLSSLLLSQVHNTYIGEE